jgi:hypothetical protein
MLRLKELLGDGTPLRAEKKAEPAPPPPPPAPPPPPPAGVTLAELSGQAALDGCLETAVAPAMRER